MFNLLGCDNHSVGLNKADEIQELDYLIVERGRVALPLTPFNTLNPLMTNNLYYHYFSKLIFEGLFEFNERLEPIPQLVSTYTIKNGGKTISVKLREGIHWHDGEKLTSSDIIFTINTLKNLNTESIYARIYSSGLEEFKSTQALKAIDAKALDEYNVEINFEQSSSNNIEMLTFPIIPKHLFRNERGNTNYSSALEIENYIPIGTGPYEFVSYDKNKSINLKANEDYRSGVPSISVITGKVLKNEELFKTAYESGQLNIVPAIGVDWDKYKQNDKIRIMEFVSSNYEFLGFNFSKEIFSNEKGISLRQAMNYAIDRQEIISKVYLGHATGVDTPINPNSWLISEEANIYGYNVELSSELLAKAGFFDNNEDGILEDEQGNKLSFKLITTPSNLYRRRVAEMIREDLKVIGVEIVLNFDLNSGQNLEGILYSGDYDIALLGWQMSVIPELSFIFHSSQNLYNNFIGYSNANMDSLLISANNCITKEDKLMAYNDLQKLITKDLPYLSLYYKNEALLVDSKIKGELNPTFFNPYNGLAKCFIAFESE